MKIKLTIFILLALLLFDISAYAENVSRAAENSAQEPEKVIELADVYRPTYLIFQQGSPNPTDGERLYTKLQFNFKERVYKDLFFAYTLKALWSINSASAPFRDYNHNPEVFYETQSDRLISFGRIGYEHESNGMGGEDSRSWDRIYWEPRLVCKKSPCELWVFDSLAVYLKGWIIAGDISDNKDIADFHGYSELTVKLSGDKDLLFIRGRKGTKKNKGNIQIDYMHTIYNRIDLYFQFWDGYGETLRYYDNRSVRYGVGVALTR